MRIKHVPDTFEKLQVLGGMATDDVLSRPEPTSRTGTPYTSARRNSVPGVYKASMPNGKTISLMRVMFTRLLQVRLSLLPKQQLGAEKALRVQGRRTGERIWRTASPPHGKRTLPELRHRGKQFEDYGTDAQGYRRRP